MRLKLVLAYDGAAYAGWQIQAGGARTIQGAVEAALFALAGARIRVIGAGRTDAGVHALGQAAHCDAPERDLDWRRALNAHLPADIRILSAERAAPGFHALRDAASKTYIYQFWRGRGDILPHLRHFAWAAGDLDFEAMRAGLGQLRGRHDFASFQNAGTPVRSTERVIMGIGLEPGESVAWLPGGAQLLRLSITGDGFLKQMVRNIAGFIAAVGLGRADWRDLAEILAARDRRSLPTATAPAKGLFLARVDYGGGNGCE